MIVVDTNIVSYFYLNSENSELAEQIFKVDSVWGVPLLWRSEFRNVLSFYLQKKIIDLSDAEHIINLAEDLLQENEYEVNSFKVLKLTQMSGCSAYGCEFVCLAKDLGVTLVTEDKKILRQFSETAQSMRSFLGVV